MEVKGYGVFTAGVAGAAAGGAVLGAAAEYIIGAAAGDGAFWGAPRLFYQLSFGAEALWLAVAAAVFFAPVGAVYYALSRRRAMLSPALFVVVVAAGTAVAARFVATFDRPWVHAADAKSLTLFATAAAFAAAAALTLAYAGLERLCRRVGVKPAVMVYAARLVAVAVLAPVVVAEGGAMWRARGVRPRGPDVYLVVVDALRADCLRPYGSSRCLMPRLEAFAGDAVLFREAYSDSSWTKPAVATLFTSVEPREHGVTSRFVGIPATAYTLPEYLRAAGYATVGVSANPNISRLAEMGDGFDILDNTLGGSILEAAGPFTSLAAVLAQYPAVPACVGPLFRPTLSGFGVNRRLKFWRRLAGGGPHFFYVHYMEPHSPNPPRPEYAAEWGPYRARVTPARASEIASGYYFFEQVVRDPAFRPNYNEDEVAFAKALYNADVRRADLVLGDLLDSLGPAFGGDAGPVVVITADHGEEFLEHDRWLHGASLHREITEIPLVVKAPGGAPAVVGGAVSLLDVAPTVAALTGGEAPRAWEGEALTPYMNGGVVPPRALWLAGVQTFYFAGCRPRGCTVALGAIVADGYYYLRDDNAGREYLYDLEADPRQRNNLAVDAGFPDREVLLRARRARLAAWRAAAVRKALARRSTAPTPRLERSLRALGYVK